MKIEKVHMTLAVMVLVMDTEWTPTYMGPPKMSPVNPSTPKGRRCRPR